MWMIGLFVLLTAPSFAQQSVPEIAFDSVPNFLKLPHGTNFGEVSGVAVNSKGHVFVFTRSNSAGGPAYAPSAAQLLEFDAQGELVGEIGLQPADRQHRLIGRLGQNEPVAAGDLELDDLADRDLADPPFHDCNPLLRKNRNRRPWGLPGPIPRQGIFQEEPVATSRRRDGLALWFPGRID